MQKKTGAQFIDPKLIFGQVKVSSGWHVADFGCGAGHFTLEMARQVGENGMVYSFDILSQAHEAVKSSATLENLRNIITQRVNLEKEGGSKLEDNSLDFVLVKDMLFQNKDKDIILGEVRRVLKDTGRVLVVEWKKEEGIVGPNQIVRVSKEEVHKILERNGFSVEKDIEAGDFHYALVALKKK